MGGVVSDAWGWHLRGREMRRQSIWNGQWPNRPHSRIRSPRRCDCGKRATTTRLSEAEQGVALDPSDADSRAVLAEVLIYRGKPEAALTAIEVARRLDPHNRRPLRLPRRVRSLWPGAVRRGSAAAGAGVGARLGSVAAERRPTAKPTVIPVSCSWRPTATSAVATATSRRCAIGSMEPGEAWVFSPEPSSPIGPSRNPVIGSGLPKGCAAPGCPSN